MVTWPAWRPVPRPTPTPTPTTGPTMEQFNALKAQVDKLAATTCPEAAFLDEMQKRIVALEG